MFAGKAGTYPREAPMALPINTRLGCEGLPGTNTSLLRKSVNYGHNKFYSTGPRVKVIVSDKLTTVLILAVVKVSKFVPAATNQYDFVTSGSKIA
jgi:hypothetical protein